MAYYEQSGSDGEQLPEHSWAEEIRDSVLREVLDGAELYSPEEQRRIDLQEMLSTPASEISTKDLLKAAKRFHPDQH
jgi:hypothetical protein